MDGGKSEDVELDYLGRLQETSSLWDVCGRPLRRFRETFGTFSDEFGEARDSLSAK